MFETTCKYFLYGASGSSTAETVHALPAPAPLGGQYARATPHGKYMSKKRLIGLADCADATEGDSESSHGRANPTPTPRSTLRRDNQVLVFIGVLRGGNGRRRRGRLLSSGS